MSGICLNEDNSNFFMSFPSDRMNSAGVRAHAEGYARGQVQQIIWNCNSQRASFGSQVIEPAWAGVTIDGDGRQRFMGNYLSPNLENWIINARLLHERGVNPYAEWLDVTREQGREAWISCRMNDLHCVDDETSIMHDAFWREHPEYRRAPYEGTWFGKALDYSFAEVRDYRLALLKEYLELFDMDGLELDWSRFPAYLKPGYELDDAGLLTDFMREVRSLTREASVRWHHAIRLGVRLPSRPELARRMGFDFIAWRDEELMDVVTVTNFWPTTDSDMPLELWRGLLGSAMELNAGLEVHSQAWPGGSPIVNTAEITAGFASQYLYRGVDHIYLFNYMNGLTGMQDKAAFEQVLTTCGDEETAYPQARRHVMTYCVSTIPGVVGPADLPCQPSCDWNALRLNVGGGTASRVGYAVFGFEGQTAPSLQVLINGEDCGDGEPCELAVPQGVTALTQYRLPSRALHDGDNVAQFRLKDGEASRIVWFEFYLP